MEPEPESPEPSEIKRLKALYTDRLMEAQARGDLLSSELYGKLLSQILVGDK